MGNKWISVKDKLPEKYIHVLTYAIPKKEYEEFQDIKSITIDSLKYESIELEL